MTKKEKKQAKEAWRFLVSMRGNLIMSQALTVAIETLEKVPTPFKEISNIEDMKFLRDNLFDLWNQVREVHALAVAEREAKLAKEQG